MFIDDLKFSLHVVTHPLDGFWDLKYEKRGKLYMSFIFIFLWFITNIIEKGYTSFLFNAEYNLKLDLVKELRSVLLIFLLFCIANWSVTTLMDGKGFFRDIVMVFGYASLPMSVLRLLAVIFSNAAAPSEASYYNLIVNFAYLSFLVLLFTGIMMIHDYSFAKAVATTVVTIFSMFVLIFILMILYTIFAQMLQFGLMFYKELSSR